jgi:hypothetical protein
MCWGVILCILLCSSQSHIELEIVNMQRYDIYEIEVENKSFFWYPNFCSCAFLHLLIYFWTIYELSSYMCLSGWMKAGSHFRGSYPSLQAR